MMEEGLKDIETSNINFKWLENIYEQLKNIQDMERLAKEGCVSLIEYLQIPFQVQKVLLPEVQYKNLKFITLEFNMLIVNLSPILKDKTEKYQDQMKTIIENIDNRELFLKEIFKNNQVVQINVTNFFYATLNFIIKIKSELIKDIGHILYFEEQDKKSW